MIPVLDPWLTEPRFSFVEDYPVVRVTQRKPAVLRFTPLRETYEPVETRTCYARFFRSPDLGEVIVACTPEDEDRLLDILRAAESVILFFSWLARGAP